VTRADGSHPAAGQATILLLGLTLVVLVGALLLGAVARGIGAHSDQQRAADLAALAGARAMREAYAGLFEAPRLGGRPNAAHVERAEYLGRGRRAALETARRNGARDVQVSFPDDDTFAPVRVRAEVRDAIDVGAGERVPVGARAEAELAPPAQLALGTAAAGEYRGPLAQRQGQRMRPDVAAAFDRMHATARRDGIALVVVSGFRSNAEQAALFARHPDPKWVAAPGRSLHRLGTELDLGPPAAYGWLAAHATRFHFARRYSWEPWHYGFTLNAGTSSVGFGGADGEAARGIPSFVPAQFGAPLARAAQRWNVSAALLAAQIMVESNFNPFARSPAGAQGISQFMPATAAAVGLRDPFDAAASIDAQAHLMRDLLRRFGSVPLALAAYNAGARPVAACGCVPPYPETRGYVARILGLLGAAGQAVAGGGLEVRLVS
jgi:soluble lytic murein transglycosylase-like protein